MSLAYFADSKAIVLRPGITEDRSDLTKEEWLGRLQKKSIERGRPITWREIKDDPSLDHDQILSKLGPYTTYENRLFCSVRDVVQSRTGCSALYATLYRAQRCLQEWRAGIVRQLQRLRFVETM